MDITRQACGVNSFHVSLIRDIHVIYKLQIKIGERRKQALWNESFEC